MDHPKSAWSNLRGIAIVGVMFIHLTASRIEGSAFSTYVNLGLNQISRFAVPVFLIASGYGLMERYGHKIADVNIKKYYLKRFKILPLYLIWALFYHLLSNEWAFNTSEIVGDILLGNAYPHLYFMVILLVCYILFPLIIPVLKSKWAFLFLLIIALYGQLLFVLGIEWGEIYFINYFIYFAIGTFLSTHRKYLDSLLKNHWLWFIGGVILMIWSAYYSFFNLERPLNLLSTQMRPTVIIYSLGFMAVFLTYFRKPNRILAYIDRHSLGIYYIHYFFVYYIRNWGAELLSNPNSFVATFAYFVIALGLSIASIKLYGFFRRKVTNWGLMINE